MADAATTVLYRKFANPPAAYTADAGGRYTVIAVTWLALVMYVEATEDTPSMLDTAPRLKLLYSILALNTPDVSLYPRSLGVASVVIFVPSKNVMGL